MVRYRRFSQLCVRDRRKKFTFYRVAVSTCENVLTRWRMRRLNCRDGTDETAMEAYGDSNAQIDSSGVDRKRNGRTWCRAVSRGRHALSILHSGRRSTGPERLLLCQLRAMSGHGFRTPSVVHPESVLCRRAGRRRTARRLSSAPRPHVAAGARYPEILKQPCARVCDIQRANVI